MLSVCFVFVIRYWCNFIHLRLRSSHKYFMTLLYRPIHDAPKHVHSWIEIYTMHSGRRNNRKGRL